MVLGNCREEQKMSMVVAMAKQFWLSETSLHCYSSNGTYQKYSDLVLRPILYDVMPSCKWELFTGDCAVTTQPLFFMIAPGNIESVEPYQTVRII